MTPSSIDTFTLDIHWGHAASPSNVESIDLSDPPDNVTWDPMTREFAITHSYLDDDPGDDPSNEYTIRVIASDGDTVGDDTGTNAGQVTVQVDNVASS